jgi:hypothetical protein
MTLGEVSPGSSVYVEWLDPLTNRITVSLVTVIAKRDPLMADVIPCSKNGATGWWFPGSSEVVDVDRSFATNLQVDG